MYIQRGAEKPWLTFRKQKQGRSVADSKEQNYHKRIHKKRRAEKPWLTSEGKAKTIPDLLRENPEETYTRIQKYIHT